MVDRPSFHIWQPLEAESLQWEGQVLIVGGVTDMPALLAVTSERLALIANGQIMLDFPRNWLRPQPALAAANGVRLFVNPVGVSGDAHPVLLRVREGRGAAVELVAVLTGRPLPKTTDAGGVLIPNWKDTVGAAKAVALPTLDDEDMSAGRRAPEAWPPQESAAIAPMPAPQQRAQTTSRPADRPMQTLADRRRAMAEPNPGAGIREPGRAQAGHSR